MIKILRKLGIRINLRSRTYARPQVDIFIKHVVETVRPYTMTSVERIAALIVAIDYLEKNSVEGDFGYGEKSC